MGALGRLLSGLGTRQGCGRREALGAGSTLHGYSSLRPRTPGADEGIFIATRRKLKGKEEERKVERKGRVEKVGVLCAGEDWRVS